MEQVIALRSVDEERVLLGARDRLRRMLGQRFGVEVVSRGGQLRILGQDDAVAHAHVVVLRALEAIRRGVDEGVVERILFEASVPEPDTEATPHVTLAPGIKPRSAGQQRYAEALHQDQIVISIGPAGSGKTFLAVACAVAALKRGEYRRLVLARPAVEAGEKLGFLPGDMQAKVNPYLRPLYDALFALLDPNQVRRYLESDVIEIVPLAYMRGRTLERSFIILDEAQNTTPKQMKMFLTRMGEASRVVVTGDVTQTDLPPGMVSGLTHCVDVLRDVKGISIVRLDREDIVRHPLVQKIVDAYDKLEGNDVEPKQKPLFGRRPT
ncbi:MAG: PhoH family protein [Planctomycetes bacterium]|nr:PhoH family protein [Planctomycetota bacterium]MCC7172779.1 PhoH family protein [Planctomycetota bacterium]